MYNPPKKQARSDMSRRPSLHLLMALESQFLAPRPPAVREGDCDWRLMSTSSNPEDILNLKASEERDQI